MRRTTIIGPAYCVCPNMGLRFLAHSLANFCPIWIKFIYVFRRLVATSTATQRLVLGMFR